MCFNEQVSIITYLSGLLGTALLYKQNYKPEALFYAWVIQMQLIEFYLWRNQPCKINTQSFNNNVNITKFGIIVNHLEPIILWLAVIYLSKKKLPKEVNYYMIFFIIVSIVYTLNALKKIECTTVSEESKPHLHWKWNNQDFSSYYYAIFLIALALVSYYGLEKGTFNSVIIIMSFFVSFLVYREKHTVGAMWCFMAAFAPWLILFIYNLN